MESTKTKGETRAGDVVLKLRDSILNCELVPGEKLRFEALKDRFEVSFSTLREALARLAAERLVISEGHRGFVVAPVSLADLEDLTNARILVERELVRLSMLYGDDAWEANIMAAYHRMDRMEERLGKEFFLDPEWSRLHGEFHNALLCACRSPVLLEMRDKLFERAHRYRRMSSRFRTKWRPKGVQHRAIMDAVIDRLPEALDLVEQHIRETTDNVVEHAGHLFSDAPPKGKGTAKVVALGAAKKKRS